MSEQSDLIDVSSMSRIVQKDGEWVIEKKTTTKKFNTILRRWKKVNEEIEYLPLSAWNPPLTKKIEKEIVFRKSAIDTYSLQPLEAFFRQKLIISANPNDSNEYLNECEGLVFLHDLRTMVSQVLSMRDPRVRRIGKPRRISKKEIMQYLKEGNFVYFEKPDGELVISFEHKPTRIV